MRLFSDDQRDSRITTLEIEGDALRRTVEEHAATVLAREASIRACEAVVVEREEALHAYAAKIQVQDQMIIAGRAELADCEKRLAASEAAVAERVAATASLEVAVRQCEQVVRDREATVAAREAVIQGYEQAMQIVGATLRVREASALPTSTPFLDGDADGQPRRGFTWTDSRKAPPLGAPVVGRDRTMTQADVDRALADWKIVAQKYAVQGLWGGQKLIEPYLVERRIHDRIGYLIMATIESQLWYDNTHSIELPELLRFGMIRQGDTVFDCGSNQGLHSVSYARAVGPAGRVVAFDPFALHVDIGQFNAGLNDVANIDFIQAGVSHKAEQLMVSMVEQCVGSPEESAEARSISVLQLDSFRSLQPSYIKIDIEGAEVNALEGASELLKTKPFLYIEVHPNYLPRFDRKPMDVFKHVSFQDYQFYIHHPGVPPYSDYNGQFEITEGCALYCVPRSHIGYKRHLHASSAS